MGRRIKWLGVVMVLCFALVIIQLVNIQFVRGPALADSPNNPRNEAKRYDNVRGEILAANGEVLAQSVRAPKGSGPYYYMRQYPQGSLFSQIVGYSSQYYGTSGVEYVYNNQLIAHSHAAQSFSQLLTPPPPTTDDVTLTVEPYLQKLAEQELASIPSANKDGAIIVLDPHTGAVLAMYSSPTFNPNLLANPNVAIEQAAGHDDFDVKDSEGFYPGYAMATFDPLPPGSTFKVVTTTAVYNLAPALSGFTFPVAPCTSLPDTTKLVCNDAETPALADPCGGDIAQMLPPSCDPGYAELGLALGASTLSRQAELFGYNSVPPIDLTNVAASHFPAPSAFSPSGSLGLPGLAYSAFGQQDDSATALQQAMVASAVADGGVVMTPHVMSAIYGSNGQLIRRYKPSVYRQAMSAAAAQKVNDLMQAVATAPDGTAYGIFPASLDVAVKTGTAQTGLPDPETNTHDWMIAFAPADDPQVAVAVLVPYQQVSSSGAAIAGPIMRAMLEAALSPASGQ